MLKNILILNIVFLLAFSSSVFCQNSKGKVSGTAVDAETGDPLIGANIYLENTSMGSASDLDGNFLIMGVPAGNYTLIVSVIGYADTKVTDIVVKAGEITKISIAAKPEILTTETVVVEAKALQNTEASLLKSRQKADAVSDAISAEAMAQAGSGNAADAMKQITGVSVVGGKYVYVRGLGDRYTSTQLNGAELPSTDPYRRSGSIDMIPSSMIDNIQTIKSFTPDKPGDFSGGTVDIKTKDFPDKLTFNVSTSGTYNSQSTYNGNAIGYNGSSTDWLGMDDGKRDIPVILKDKNVYIPTTPEASKDPGKKESLIDMTNSFTKDLGPVKWTPPLNQSYALSFGNQVKLFNRPLGFLASFSYKRDNSSYDNGVYQHWELGLPDTLANTLTSLKNFKDEQTKDEVLWGGLIKTSYKFAPNHVISFNGMYNQNGESTARYLVGKYIYNTGGNAVYRTSALTYNERTLKTVQLDGEHMFQYLFNTKLTWKGSIGNTTENQPDLRFFTDKYSTLENGQKQYSFENSTPPTRYFRDLNEDRKEFSADLAIPFKQWAGYSSNIKIGFSAADKKRTYSERQFIFDLGEYGYGDHIYTGNPDELLASANTGIYSIDTSIYQNRITHTIDTSYTSHWGVSVKENTLPNNVYDASQSISANYAMLELPLSNALKFVGGARYEVTNMHVNNSTSHYGFDTHDWLPSANLIYALADNMNIRLAYSKSLARPTFREMSPFATIDFFLSETVRGNPNLKRTLIKNYDFRWEWFSRPGEIYAVSLFYKDFNNPIERVYNALLEISWENINKAKSYGIELEFRKRLDVIHESLHNFLLGSNVSLIHSEHRITDDEWIYIRDFRPSASRTRPFQGQSPYLINANLTYENPELRLSSTVYFNVFGKRLDTDGIEATPDIYEKPAALLNFSNKWSFTDHLNIKFAANNILNPDFTKYSNFKGKEYIKSKYKKGISYSFGLGYNF